MIYIKKKIIEVCAGLATAFTTCTVASVPIFAVSMQGANYFSKALTLMTNVINPIAAVMLAVATMTIFFSRSQKNTETAMDWGKKIVISFIAINMLGSILNFVGSATGSSFSSFYIFGKKPTEFINIITYINSMKEGALF